jgi:general secretion pathway protein G
MYRSNIEKRFVTLIEMMIVMFLIALITGVVAYNYRGSLDEGKAFKTKTGMEKLETILNMEVAKNPQYAANIQSEWQKYVLASPLVHDPQALLRDGWGEEYQVTVDEESGAIRVDSRRFEEYRRTHNTLFSN